MKFKTFIFVALLLLPLPVHSLDLTPVGDMPKFKRIQQWFNSAPITQDSLKGKVVLVDFWTFGCANCARTFPHLIEWHKKYKDEGLVVIGVHSPEFEYEKNLASVKKAISKYQIPYPVAVDNQLSTWREYGNMAWPTHYFIDGQGKIRYVHLGEGRYKEQEKVIKRLLRERRAR